jgi:hypothetical protein
MAIPDDLQDSAPNLGQPESSFFTERFGFTQSPFLATLMVVLRCAEGCSSGVEPSHGLYPHLLALIDML